MKMGCIYGAKCKTTGKYYIGKSVNFKHRRARHLAERITMPKKHPKFFNALNKYGPNNFSWSILQDGLKTNKQMNKREKFWIKKLDSWKNGYNCNSGGEGWQSGSEHPKWKGGFDKKAWSKQYHIKYKKEDAIYAKKHNKKPLTEQDMRLFWSFVNKSNKCWIWNGHISKSNGPVFRSKQVRRIIFGKILSKELRISLKCDNIRCVNPKHFIFTTCKEMGEDFRKKYKGKQYYNTKTNEKSVIKIRKMYKTGKYSQAELGRRFGLTSANIFCIVNNKTWRYLL